MRVVANRYERRKRNLGLARRKFNMQCGSTNTCTPSPRAQLRCARIRSDSLETPCQGTHTARSGTKEDSNFSDEFVLLFGPLENCVGLGCVRRRRCTSLVMAAAMCDAS